MSRRHKVKALCIDGRRLSVCLSVPCLTKSRMEGRSKLKIDRKEAHDTGDP